MEFRDLRRFTYEHIGSLAFDPEIPETIPDAIAIGWLHESCPQTGDVDNDLMDAIRFAHREQRVDCGELGYHGCGLCWKNGNKDEDVFEDRGEFTVRWDDRIYVLPRMVVHYIEAHGYCPPQFFLDDLFAWWGSIAKT